MGFGAFESRLRDLLRSGAARGDGDRQSRQDEAVAATARRLDRRILLAQAVFTAVVVLLGVLFAHDPAAQVKRKPVPLVGPALPGAVGLGRWTGAGNKVITPPAHQVVPGHELAITVACTGDGPVSVGPVSNPDCAGPVTGSVDSATALRLQVTASEQTNWEFGLLDQRASLTNGVLVALPNPTLQAPADERLASRDGTGSAVVPVARPGSSAPSLANLRIVVTCFGRGLSISTQDGDGGEHFTHTCFHDWSYVFDVTGARLPITLRVVAGEQTTWHLVAVPFLTSRARAGPA